MDANGGRPPWTQRRVGWLPIAIIAAVIVIVGVGLSFAFAGDDEDSDPASPLSTSTASLTVTPTRTHSPSATPVQPTATPTASPTVEPTPTGEEAAQEAIDAAIAELDAIYVSPLSLDACLEDNPEEKICIELDTAASQLEGGVAEFSAGDPLGGGFAFVMALDGSGNWRYWYGTQQPSYFLRSLPGTLIVCGGGDGVIVRAGPSESAAEVESFEDLDELSAVQFVLTEPGAFRGGAVGDGWYRIEGPVAGWVPARSTADASLGDCTLRDDLEGASRG